MILYFISVCIGTECKPDIKDQGVQYEMRSDDTEIFYSPVQCSLGSESSVDWESENESQYGESPW